MAKISARGASKVAQASKSWTDEDGWQHKQRLALRSDGKVLRAHDLLSPERVSYGAGWNRGSYSITSVKLTPATTERFRQHVATLDGFELS